MAKDGADNGETDGWGQYLGNYTMGATVVNKAIAGRSARSYWEEGRFSDVADLVVEGDIVVIEFGHNDGGSPESDDNGRSDCPGEGEEVCTSDADGSTVYTFVYYISEAAKLFIGKGATVVLATQTPNNPCKFCRFSAIRPRWCTFLTPHLLGETGSFVYDAPRFVDYQKVVANAVNDASCTYVDHFNAVALMYEQLGDDTVTGYFPSDQ